MYKPEFLKPKAEELFDQDELAARKLAIAKFEPRREYAEGELKLDFGHRFPDGAVLRAKEDEAGSASFTLEKNGRIIDFSGFLPEGFKFVTPSYSEGEEDLLPSGELGRWNVDHKSRIIWIGDMKGPEHIFALLHEIGHGWQPPKVRQKNDKALIKHLSWRERDAWAKAIGIARSIKRGYGTDFFALFDSPDKFKEFFYGTMLTHRYKRTSQFIAGRPVVKDIWEYLDRKLHEKERFREEAEFTSRLFDKGKLRRGQAQHED